jgi:hypothetical protein
MKRTSMKNKQLELKRRLALVRTTVRALTPTQLEQVIGGANTNACPNATGLACECATNDTW